MTDWSELITREHRIKRGEFSRSLLLAIDNDCLTRRPRDPMKRKLMLQLGFVERYTEVQHPSPGNTPNDLDDDEL